AFPGDWSVRFADPAELGQAESLLAEAEVLIPEHVMVDAAFLAKCPKLRLVQTGAGYDNVDLGACAARGVWACNAAGVNADAVAEHVWAMILCWYKNIARLDAFMRSGGDEKTLSYAGAELGGRTIGILGMGRIGTKVAGIARAFGMNVLGYSRRQFDRALGERAEPERLYAQSDVVTVHLPLNEGTRHMVGAEAFARMKPDALLVNTSRGALLDEEALIRALQNGEIGGACLDVYEREPLAQDSPLRSLDNVILTPHTAGLPDGVKFHKKRYAFFARNIAAVAGGGRPECVLCGPARSV
ncbi:MAG: hypothetical protein J6Z30_05905, partial [Pyramidobacter sp.]|nr:hypothetical protein [Pyramidobacter sp.]